MAVLVDGATRSVRVSWLDETVHLTGYQTAALKALVRGMPDVVPHEVLIATIWPYRSQPAFPRDVLKVHINNLRKRIDCFGLRIVGDRNVGYRLTREQASV